MTKEEKIKEVYKKYFNECDVDHRFYISINGWSDKLNLELINDDEFLKELDIRQTTFRPKSLQGIEDNNGWISLSGEPNEIDTIPNLELYNINTKEYYVCTDPFEFIEIGRFTHYKPIVKSNPPIY